MQHWYACQAERSPMTDYIVLNLLIGAMYLHILQLPHTHYMIFPAVADTHFCIYMQALSVN